MSYSELERPGTAGEKILASRRAASNVADFIRAFPEATWGQTERTILGTVYDLDVRRGLLAEVKEFRRWRWKPSHLEKNPRIQQFLLDLEGSALKSLSDIDHLSAVGAHRVEHVGNQESRRWYYQNPQRLVSNYDRGGFGLVSGPPGKGKTSAGLYIAEQWRIKDPRRNAVVTNIRMRDPPSLFFFADSLRQLFRVIVGTGERGDPAWEPGLAKMDMRYLFVWDEGGSAWRRNRAASDVNQTLDTLAKQIGKNNGNLLFIEQLEGGVPSALVAFSANTYQAVAPGTLLINQGKPDWQTGIRDPKLDTWRFQTQGDFPRSTVQYDPDDRAFFRIDLDLFDMGQSIAGRRDQVEAIRWYLQGLDHREEKKAEARKVSTATPINFEAVQASREAKMNWQQISLATGIPYGTLRRRYAREAKIRNVVAK